jgi:predicted acyl esterase
MLKLTIAGTALGLLVVPATAGAAISVGGSVNQVYVTGADPGTKLRLFDRNGDRVGTEPAGSLGGAIFRRVDAGKGYRVKEADGTMSARVKVIKGRNAPPTTAIYNQRLTEGYQYITMRDGTKLAATVRLPSSVADGPFPTVVEYSGYGYADPNGPESGIAPILNLLGYAVVDVNMRGTGCSGGAFDFFERLQGLDGYDVVETVSRQSWVKGGRVGMAGLSYGGISQLFVGATNPPHLVGITPLSVIEGTATTLYPGGLLNTGFAFEWAEDRAEDAQPAGPGSTQGQRWAYNRIQNGDTVCAENQVLHTAATKLLEKVRRNHFFRPRVVNPLTPSKFVNKIKMPVFLACQFNDEQTGAFCPDLTDRFTGTKKKWFTYTNGLHVDALDPETFNRWFDFLEIYVNQEKPEIPPVLAATAPVVYQQVMGVPGVTLPPDHVQQQPTFEAAKSVFEKLPRVRILFDNGAGGMPNHPYPGFERSFNSLPIKGTKARSWFFGEGGTLLNKPPKNPGGSDTFVWDKESRPFDNFAGTNTSGGDLWSDDPSYNWMQSPPGKALSYITPPLAADTGIVGAGAVNLWLKASVPDVDLQVTVSEVRPDGKETYVQSGWLRTSRRKLDAKRSTLLEPIPTHFRDDAKKLPKGEFTKVIVPLYYQGHVYRAGSQIRLTITAPSGDQPVWSFNETVPNGDANVTVAFAKRRPSRLILPLIPGLDAPTPLPACPALRGEPCRNFTP